VLTDDGHASIHFKEQYVVKPGEGKSQEKSELKSKNRRLGIGANEVIPKLTSFLFAGRWHCHAAAAWGEYPMPLTEPARYHFVQGLKHTLTLRFTYG
jgi:hypothetical protein